MAEFRCADVFNVYIRMSIRGYIRLKVKTEHLISFSVRVLVQVQVVALVVHIADV